MVKIHVAGRPEYDNTEICFRDFRGGSFQEPYYTSPETDTIVGWWENSRPNYHNFWVF